MTTITGLKATVLKLGIAAAFFAMSGGSVFVGITKGNLNALFFALFFGFLGVVVCFSILVSDKIIISRSS